MTKLIDIEESLKKLNRLFGFLVIPVVGMLIPNLTGLIRNHFYSPLQLFLAYCLFIFVSLLIWKGNLFFLVRLRNRYEKMNADYFKMLLTSLAVNVLYSTTVCMLFLSLWTKLSPEKEVAFHIKGITVIVLIVFVLIINALYEIVLLRKEIAETIVQSRKMEIAKMQAELEALKAEIDPHFIFNSLNTLSYLITQQPATAKLYNETLAKVYRYILFNKDKDLVFLKDELDFITNYFFLIKIRFEKAIDMVVEVPEAEAGNFLITPVSLQILIENAIKHNFFSNRNPLTIHVHAHSMFVTVRNKIRKKTFEAKSSGIGLKNLEERYQLIMNKNIIIDKEEDEFLVSVPLLKA